jgi:hypothetical protein
MMSRLSAITVALGALMLSSAAMACDSCGYGYGGGHEIYSCNNALYDCRVEQSYYTPRCDDGCGYGRAHTYIRGYRHGYRDGFHDGYDTASYEEDDRGFYDDGHKFHSWERWRDGDGHWRDGWHDDKGGWHDRDFHDGHDGHDGWRDGDRRDDHDWHDDDHHDGHDGDHHDGDGDHHDDHHDGDHHDHP